MRIFARSLLSYWLTTGLTVGLAAVLLVSTGTASKDQTRTLPLRRLEGCASRLIARLPQQCEVSAVFDAAGRKVWGAAPSTDTLRLLRQEAAGAGAPVVELRPDETLIAFEVKAQGSLYRAVAVLPLPRGRVSVFFWLHLLIAIGISGLIFWLLARQFSEPILELQSVADEVARGSMRTRPNGKLLKRKDELGDLSRSIDVMVRRIGDLMQSKKAFLVQISHELGSPLTRLNLALALARRKANLELTPELRRIEYEAGELNSMVQQLLLLARLENATEHEYPQQQFSIAQLVREVAEDAQFEARQGSKDVSLLVADEAQWHTVEILGYRDLLKRALDNVVRNAIRYTPEQGLVEIACATDEKGRVLIGVRDYGKGIAEEKLELIFEPFLQIAEEGRSSGAGLGLAIARHAVLVNGGRIHASNAAPHGLLVAIELPALAYDV